MVGEFGELDVGDAVAEELLLGKLLGEDDLGGDEEGGLAGFVGNGDIDEGAVVVALAAFEAEAAARHVFAGDDVVAALGMADASGVADFNARVLAAIDTGRIRLGRGRRHGENGTEALHDKLGAGGVNRGLRRSRGLRQRLRRGVERRLRRRNWGRWQGGCGRGGATPVREATRVPPVVPRVRVQETKRAGRIRGREASVRLRGEEEIPD